LIGAGTIAAVASPPGRSPRAILRLSGPDAPAAIQKLASLAWTRGVFKARLALPGLEIPALAILYPAPDSFTGEDSAELLVSGSPHIARAVLEALLAIDGVRLAGPGEFSARAYLAGRLTLEQAEGVATMISATSAEEADAARRLLSGEAGAETRDWIDRLATLLALVEAGVDFTDQEDVVPIPAPELLTRLRRLAQEIDARVAGPAVEPPPEGPLVALAGPPNAGKTTLFNALLGRVRGVVSREPGATRDAIVEPLLVRGARVRLADLAGLDEALADRSALDAAAQERARAALREADAILWCDPTGRFDHPTLRSAANVVRVRTKADLLVPSETREALAVCALDGFNLDSLREAIADAALGAADAAPRRRRALVGALVALRDALEALDRAGSEREVESPEVIAGALREALDALGELAGDVSPDDIIARVFATFCVGK
jgi:tRNA modification GTPase